jgi:hypothetical protein
MQGKGHMGSILPICRLNRTHVCGLPTPPRALLRAARRLQLFEQMTTAERVQAAKAKTQRVIDHLLYLLALHENNAIIVYSPTLASQIPRSYAANAFNLFREGMHRFEIVRLCALWDPPSAHRESIPTIVKLIDDEAVIDALVEETHASWTGGIPVDPSEDPELDAAARATLIQLNEQRAQEKTAEARVGINQSIEEAREIEKSAQLASLRSLRNERLAHSLSIASTAQPMPTNVGCLLTQSVWLRRFTCG